MKPLPIKYYQKEDALFFSENLLEKSLLSTKDILASPRVGVAYAGEDALLPW